MISRQSLIDLRLLLLASQRRPTLRRRLLRFDRLDGFDRRPRCLRQVEVPGPRGRRYPKAMSEKGEMICSGTNLDQKYSSTKGIRMNDLLPAFGCG